MVIDNVGDIDWATDDRYDWNKLEKKDFLKFDQIINKAAELEYLCEHFKSADGCKRLIAEGIARALDHDLPAATDALNLAEKHIRDKLQDKVRRIYLIAALNI